MNEHYRKIANAIANGDWQRSPTKGQLGKLDFVDLESRIYSALMEAGTYPSQIPSQDLKGVFG